jgi:pyochelin biosynthetic protein PchC
VTGDDRWFHRYGPTGNPAVRLVCFPHAGGSPSFFRSWPRHLPPEMEVLAVCYPGRHSRFGEPHLDTMSEVADQVTTALEPYLRTPLALFGHSMGSAIAYEVALRLGRRYGVRPVHVFASGRSAPHRTTSSALHLAPTDVLVSSVSALGYSAAAIVDEPELRALMLPTLRADFRLIETYRPESLAPMDSPLAVLVGEQDPGCDLDGARAWAEATTAEFELRVFPGDHFFLEPMEPDVLRHIGGHLRNDLRPRHAADRERPV